MDNNILINVAVDAAVKKYLLFKNNNDYSLVGDFLVYVICMLNYIYGETDIINPYLNNQSDDALTYNLARYGYNKDMVKKFYDDLLGFYQRQTILSINQDLHINEFFTYVQEDIADMYFAKIKTVGYKDQDLVNFRTMLYSPECSGKYRIKYNEITAVDPMEVVNYYDSLVNQLQNPVNLVEKERKTLNYKVYNFFGIKNEDIEDLDNDEIKEINNQIMLFMGFSPIEVNLEKKMLDKIKIYQKKNKKVLSSTSGVVNVIAFLVLFMVVIAVGIGVGILLVKGMK